MNSYAIIGSLVALAAIGLTAFLLMQSMRTRGSLARALNLVLFRISVPRDMFEGQQQRPEKELIGIMEQLYASLTNLHAKGWNKFIYGEPYVAAELSVHHVGEEIHFYMAVPMSFADIFEKHVHSVFASAEVERVKDYNIFSPGGVSVAGHVTLKGDTILPFKTYQKLESDPIAGLTTTLSKLEKEGEGAAIQILIRPSHRKDLVSLAQKVVREMQQGYDFKRAMNRAQHPSKPNNDPNKPAEAPRVVTPFEEEIIKAIQAKASKPQFDCNIRVVVSAGDQVRADQLFNDVSAAFTQFNTPNLASLNMTKATGNQLTKLLFDFSFRLFNRSKTLTLCSEELTSLYHLPVSSGSMTRVKYLDSKTSEPPHNLSPDGVLIGRNVYRGQTTEVRMAEEDRRRHMYIIGQTGTGKTVTMKAMVHQDILAGKGLCVIDPHGDFAEFALSVVPRERVDDVIYFDPGDIERPLGLNMLEIDPTHPEQKSMVVNELFGIFDKLYDLKTTGGPMFEKYFRNSALLLLDDYTHEIPTLADISRVLVDDAYRKDKLSRETNPLVKEFWELEAQKAGGESSLANMAPYISSKINTFVFDEFLRPIINQKVSAFNFRDVMDKKKILIINMSKGRIGDLNANLLGMIVVGKLLMAALARVDMEESKRNDFYLYIDEFQNFTTPSISSILSEARKYRLALILAHQFIKQLTDNIRDAVFGNVGSMLVCRVSADDAEYLKNKFAPVFSPNDIMRINNLNAYVNLLVRGQPSRPFNIAMPTELVFGAGNPQVTQVLREISKLKFGRPRAEIEAELMVR